MTGSLKVCRRGTRSRPGASRPRRPARAGGGGREHASRRGRDRAGRLHRAVPAVSRTPHDSGSEAPGTVRRSRTAAPAAESSLPQAKRRERERRPGISSSCCWTPWGTCRGTTAAPTWHSWAGAWCPPAGTIPSNRRFGASRCCSGRIAPTSPRPRGNCCGREGESRSVAVEDLVREVTALLSDNTRALRHGTPCTNGGGCGRGSDVEQHGPGLPAPPARP